jgi:membrane associated rhomboid family serine protease
MSITLIIVIITVLISMQGFSNSQVFDRLKHHPYSEARYKEYYRWLSSGFLHGDYIHLALNMFVLWQFGSIVEQYYKLEFGSFGGMLLFTLMYFSAIVVGDIVTYNKHQENFAYAAVGASGGVAGVLFAYVLFNPWDEIYVYFIPIRAVFAAVLYLFYEQWASKNSNDNIGHDAHFWGALGGLVVTMVLKPSILSNFIDQITYNSPYW